MRLFVTVCSEKKRFEQEVPIKSAGDGSAWPEDVEVYKRVGAAVCLAMSVARTYGSDVAVAVFVEWRQGNGPS